MTFSRKTLLMAAIVLGSAVVSVDSASACGRRGSSSFSYRRSSYSSYSSPSYSHYNNQVIRPVQHVQTVQPLAPQGLAPQQGLQPVPQQPLTQVQPQQQVAPLQSQPGLAQQQVAPVQQQPVSPSPQQIAPVQPQTAQSQQTAPATTQPTAQMSALQALGGFAPPAATAPASAPQQVQTPSHVGTWSANLGNGASVRLDLKADGTFVWSATNKTGTASSFSGTYTVSNGALSLLRSNDSQQLSGSMTLNGTNAFSFKVAGNNAAAISFARA